MALIVKMPKLGLEMEQGTLLEWFHGQGDEVSEGDVIAEVESEKSIGEVEAREDGVIRRTYLDAGDAIPPGKPIGILAGADEDISELEAEVEATLNGEAASTEDDSSSETEAVEAEAGSGGGGGSASPSSGSGDVKASPRAKQRAEDLGVDLTTVEGTGPMDSITEADVETAAEGASSGAESVKASPRAKKLAEDLGVDLTTVEGTGPMGSISADDVEAAAEEASSGGEADDVGPATVAASRFQRTTAVADPAAGEALLGTTEAVRSAFEERVTVTDVVLVVASAALADEPVLNGTYAESTHQVHTRQDVALVSDGETHTVVRDVGGRSLTELVEAREDGADTDATPSFTVATAGAGDSNGLLVSKPAVAALEVDPTGQRAVPNGDGVDLQPLVTASLTYDTRAIGRREAEAFLDRFFAHAEASSGLVLETYRGTE